MKINRSYNYTRIKNDHKKHLRNDYMVTRIVKDTNDKTNEAGIYFYKYHGPVQIRNMLPANPEEYEK